MWADPESSMLLPSFPDFAATLARVALGALLLVHGWPKIKNPRAPIAWVKGTGWPGGAIFAALAVILEFFGSLGLILGFFTQLIAAFVVLEMVGTTIFSKMKLGKKFVLGYELDIVYLALALTVALLGPGPWSLDRLLGLA